MGGDPIKSYRDEERGKFQNAEKARHLISFDGMLFQGRAGVMNVTPTDIDGCIQLDENNVFIFFETKYQGDSPRGQKKALEKLCDTLANGGGKSAAFIAVHSSESDLIIVKNAIITQFYYGRDPEHRWHEWHKDDERMKSLYSGINWFIDWVKQK